MPSGPIPAARKNKVLVAPLRSFVVHNLPAPWKVRGRKKQFPRKNQAIDARKMNRWQVGKVKI